MSGIIALCGFMGCGKTYVGQRTAKLMGRRFVDLDTYIEEKAGKTINDIFADVGESGFRELEKQAVKDISSQTDIVLACGGGTVLFKENVEELHRNGGVIVLLDVPVDILKKRLKNDTERPLLQQPDRNKVIDELFEKRMPLYKSAADVRVKGGIIPWVTANRVIKGIKNF